MSIRHFYHKRKIILNNMAICIKNGLTYAFLHANINYDDYFAKVRNDYHIFLCLRLYYKVQS